jgi:hypothetical protein
MGYKKSPLIQANCLNKDDADRKRRILTVEGLKIQFCQQ